MFRRKTPIERMCGLTGGKWAVTYFDRVDSYAVRTTTCRSPYEIMIRHASQKHKTTRFQCFLPVVFSLSNPPSGLFGRLLMRSWDLRWSSWMLDIAESCEAKACLTVLVPNAGLTPVLFDYICLEMTEEVMAFHRELRDKIKYEVGSGSIRQPGDSGVPMVRTGSLRDIRYL